MTTATFPAARRFAFWTGAGRYEINRQIGQGGMVTVYLAAQLPTAPLPQLRLNNSTPPVSYPPMILRVG